MQTRMSQYGRTTLKQPKLFKLESRGRLQVDAASSARLGVKSDGDVESTEGRMGREADRLTNARNAARINLVGDDSRYGYGNRIHSGRIGAVPKRRCTLHRKRTCSAEPHGGTGRQTEITPRHNLCRLMQDELIQQFQATSIPKASVTSI